MTSQLQEAIAGLYRVFARYPLNVRMQACPCCVSGSDFARLFDGELRELEPGQLDHFAWKATTTWGTRDDYRHFLPRIFELLATQAEAVSFEPWLQVSKLEYAGWRNWPKSERQAVSEFWYALFSSTLATPPARGAIYGAADIATAIASLGLDVTRVLAEWAQSGNAGAIHLAHAVRDLGYSGRLPKDWCRDAAANRAYERWLREDERLLQLQAAESETSGEHLMDINFALQQLREFPPLPSQPAYAG
jgi:hypothetical protein